MSNISSNCLFHFTSSAEYLINILTNEFYPRYSLEKTILQNKLNSPKIECAIPMVCFCDISLGQIKNHVGTYGQYGIGMTKEWGTKFQLNPLIYVNNNSSLAVTLSNMVEELQNPKDKEDITADLIRNFMTLSKYLKPYRGDFTRNGKLIKNVKFYDEREWRYVPDLFENDDLDGVLSTEEYNNPVILAQANSKLRDYKLKFKPDDIKYIFVKDSKEILAMTKALKSIKGHKYDSDTIELLTTRILTTEQIMHDF